MREKRKLKFSTLICSFITYVIALPIQTIVFFIGFAVKLLKFEKLFLIISKFWCLFFYKIIGIKLVGKGLYNIDRTKHYLIIANHASYYDIPAIMYFLPNTIWVANKRFFDVLFFGSLLKKMGSIPVDSKNLKETIIKMEERSKKVEKYNSSSIAIFPEGTRTLDGNIHKFKRGFLSIWKNTKFDLLPVTINGTYTVKPKWSFLIYHVKKVEVIFHKSIPFDNLNDFDNKEITDKLREIINKDYENKNIS